MFKEFKEFAVKGNVIDMAVGIIIGGAFGTIVKSLVDDVLMPPIGMMLGKIDFSNMFFLLSSGAKSPAPYASLADAKVAGAVTVAYGQFINNCISFLIIALAVFFVVKMINKLKKQDQAPPADTRDCPYCLSKVPLQAVRCAYCTSELKAA